VAVRCVRCGNYIEGFAQLCGDCGGAKKQKDLDDRLRAALSTYMTCPSCSNNLARAADVCPTCQYDFRVKIRDWSFMENVGFGRRLVAWIIDAIIVDSILALLVIVSGNPEYFLFSFPITCLYHVTFWAAEGATPGKMLLGIMVVREDTRNSLSVGDAFIRYLGYIVNGIIFGVGYLMILFDPEKRGLHDRMAGTIVIEKRSIAKLAEYREEKRAIVSRHTGGSTSR
jgi:uncharacterized RDD family membrane protein YckC